MKQSYSQYSSYVKKVAKRLKIRDFDMLNSPEYINEETEESKHSFGRFYKIEREIIEGHAVHIFMPPRAFCDWLVGCVPDLKDSNGFYYGKSEYANILEESISGKVGVLHFPTNARLCSAGFFITPDNRINIFDNSQSININGIESTATIEQMVMTRMYMEKLIAGIGMYISCFPEMMTNGFPEDLKHPSFHRHKVIKKIGISAKVQSSGEREGVAPHFRSGHFRMLRSEKFTHKRYQVIFIHETFVKGQAKTVIGID